jgi:hypothetical protein
LIVCFLFDDEQGSLHSYLCPSLEKYTVFGAHSTAVIGLLAAAEGIVSLSSGCVRMHTRGGLSILNFRDKGFFDMLCCDWERPGAKRMLIGHTSAKISVLDLSTSCIATTVCVSSFYNCFLFQTVLHHITSLVYKIDSFLKKKCDLLLHHHSAVSCGPRHSCFKE